MMSFIDTSSLPWTLGDLCDCCPSNQLLLTSVHCQSNWFPGLVSRLVQHRKPSRKYFPAKRKPKSIQMQSSVWNCMQYNTTKLYSLLGRAELHWNVFSIAKDDSDIHRFSNRK